MSTCTVLVPERFCKTLECEGVPLNTVIQALYQINDDTACNVFIKQNLDSVTFVSLPRVVWKTVLDHTTGYDFIMIAVDENAPPENEVAVIEGRRQGGQYSRRALEEVIKK